MRSIVCLLILMTVLAVLVTVTVIAAYAVAVAWLGRATYRFALTELDAADARRAQALAWTAPR